MSFSTYQDVVYRERKRGDITGLALLALVGVGAILAVALVRRQAK